MNNKTHKKIVVLGIGNTLLKDEGVGVHIVNQLIDTYDFSENVVLLDGGTLGNRLLLEIEKAETLIVVDAMFNGSNPGTLYKMHFSQFRGKLPIKCSIHQTTFLEALANADFMGMLPGNTIIYGIEPKDINTLEVGLSPEVLEKTDRLQQQILDEILQHGGHFVLHTPAPLAE